MELQPTIEHFEGRLVRVTTIIKEPRNVYYQLGITFGCYNKDKRPCKFEFRSKSGWRKRFFQSRHFGLINLIHTDLDVRNIVECIDIRAPARQDSELHHEFLTRYKTRLIMD